MPPIHPCTLLYISIVTSRNKAERLFPQRDTDEEVKEHVRNNLHLQEKVMWQEDGTHAGFPLAVGGPPPI